MRKTILLLLLCLSFQFSKAQAPNWLWAVTQTGGDCFTEAHSVKASPSGDVYISGRFGGTMTLGGQTVTATGSQVVSGKFDGAGNFIWLTPHYGIGNTDYNYNIYRDPENNTYTTGVINSTMYVDKYDSNGNQLWTDVHYATCSSYGTVTDNAKNVYVTGEFAGSLTLGSTTINSVGGSEDMYLAKLDSNGNWKWVVSAGGTGYDGGRAIAIDGSGYIYVLGSYTNGATFGSITAPTANPTFPNLFIAKYDSSGNALRVTTATNSGFDTYNQWWFWQSLAVDSCGNAYVGGYFQDTAKFGKFSVVSASSLDIFVAKCNLNGNWEWVQRAGGTTSDEVYAIALDKYTDVYIGGLFTNSFQFGNQTVTSTAANLDGSPFVAKYANSTGDLQWVQTGGGTGDWSFESLTVDRKGYVYACGTGGYSGDGVFGEYTVNNNVSCGEDNFLIAKLDTTPPRKIIPAVNHIYCVGSTVQLPYSVIGSFNAGNVFTAELSDATGSFESYTVLGSVVDTANGTITITIPNVTGSTYLIRVVSSDPATSSYANSCGDYYYNGVYINNFYVTIGGNIAVSVSPSDTTICSGATIRLNAFGGDSYKWNNNDTGQIIMVTPVMDTTYKVTVNNNGCMGSDSVTVHVSSAGILTLNPASPALCEGQSVLLSASGYTSYSWTPSTGLSSTSGDTLTANPTTTTTYTISALSGNCFNSGEIVVTVNPLPALILQPLSPSVCNGQSATLTVSGATNYVWSPVAGLNATSGDTVIVTTSVTTTYTISASSGSCSVLDSIIVTVNPNPIIAVSPNPASYCIGDSSNLIASGGNTYIWSPSTGLSVTTGDSVIANPILTTVYSIIGTNLKGCSDSEQITITVNPLPVIGITPSQAICDGDSLLLTATGGESYTWSPASGLSGTTGASAMTTPAASVTYTVVVTDSAGCNAQASDTITLKYGINTPIITDTNNILTSTATEGNQWYLNGVAIDGATNKIYHADTTGCYSVTATNYANGCNTTSDTLCIANLSGINQLTGISNQLLVYPNPTGGEIFINISSSVADIKDWKLQITDVLGRTVYTRQSLNYTNEIDLSNLVSGIYFITVINNSARAVFPVVKQN